MFDLTKNYMKDADYFEFIVKDLTELEMESLLEVCRQKLNRDNMGALLESFQTEDLGAMEDLEDEVKELESKNEKLNDKLDRAKELADQAISTLQDI